MLFHIPRTFFGVEIAFAVRGGEFPENRASGTSPFAKLAIPATVFDDGLFRLDGQVGKHGGKAEFTAVDFG